MELSKEDRLRVLEAIAPMLTALAGRVDPSRQQWLEAMPAAMTALFDKACHLVLPPNEKGVDG